MTNYIGLVLLIAALVGAVALGTEASALGLTPVQFVLGFTAIIVGGAAGIMLMQV